MRRFWIVFCAPILVFDTAPVHSQSPSSATLRDIGSALGSTAADFQKCGVTWMSQSIRRRFKSALSGCEANDGSVLTAFDQSYVERLEEVEAKGGSCRGDNDARFEVTKNQIERVSDACDQ